MLLLFKQLNELGKCCIPECSWRFIMQVRMIQMLVTQTYILFLEGRSLSHNRCTVNATWIISSPTIILPPHFSIFMPWTFQSLCLRFSPPSALFSTFCLSAPLWSLKHHASLTASAEVQAFFIPYRFGSQSPVCSTTTHAFHNLQQICCLLKSMPAPQPGIQDS